MQQSGTIMPEAGTLHDQKVKSHEPKGSLWLSLMKVIQILKVSGITENTEQCVFSRLLL